MLRVVNDLLQHRGLMLRSGTAVDATLISAPSSTKNAGGNRDPEMKQAKKGNNWYFWMKAHIGVDIASGLVHTVATTPANVNDLNMAGALLHRQEHAAFGDAGYQGVHKRPEVAGPTWHVAMRPGLRRKLNTFIEADFVAERVEKMKASIRAQVEHPFRVLKRQFGLTKVRYRGLRKNTGQIVTLFALGNLWMARRRLLAVEGGVRLDGVPSGSQAAAHGRRCDRLGCFTAALRSHCSLIRSIASTTHVVQTFPSCQPDRSRAAGRLARKGPGRSG